MKYPADFSSKQRAFLMVAFLFERSDVSLLIPYLPKEEQAHVQEALQNLLKESHEAKSEIVRNEIKQLFMEPQQNILSEVHADWIYEMLKKESPRMIATILRYLPGEHVQAVLNHLPEAILKVMPPLSETFSLDPALVQILKRRFEENFLGTRTQQSIQRPREYETIVFWPRLKLKMLFREIGFREISMAFGTLNDKTIHLILKRLPPRDAALLKLRIEKNEPVSEVRLKQAQSHLLALDLKGVLAEGLIMEAGFFVYSKSLLVQNLEGARIIQQKFPLESGKILKKYIEKNLPLNSPKSVAHYRQEILKIAQSLEVDGVPRPSVSKKT